MAHRALKPHLTLQTGLDVILATGKKLSSSHLHHKTIAEALTHHHLYRLQLQPNLKLLADVGPMLTGTNETEHRVGYSL